MSQDEATTDVVSTQAADWASTILSVPLIWPKTTAGASVAAIVLFTSIAIVQLTKPAVEPPRRLDPARIAEIEQQIRLADMAVRAEMTSSAEQPTAEYLGYLHAVTDPDHVEKRHESSRVHAH